MRRKAVHLIAAIAESLRFLAVLFLAFALGALLDPSVSSLLRYAAAPQLLFAAGFFFLWLDRPRYGAYKPLLLIGKAASLACFLPLAASLAGGLPRTGIVLALSIAAVDVASLAILLRTRPAAEEPSIPAARPVPPVSASPGQGPEDIERIEGM